MKKTYDELKQTQRRIRRKELRKCVGGLSIGKEDGEVLINDTFRKNYNQDREFNLIKTILDFGSKNIMFKSFFFSFLRNFFLFLTFKGDYKKKELEQIGGCAISHHMYSLMRKDEIDEKWKQANNRKKIHEKIKFQLIQDTFQKNSELGTNGFFFFLLIF
jgi:hypothetical protein